MYLGLQSTLQLNCSEKVFAWIERLVRQLELGVGWCAAGPGPGSCCAAGNLMSLLWATGLRRTRAVALSMALGSSRPAAVRACTKLWLLLPFILPARPGTNLDFCLKSSWIYCWLEQRELIFNTEIVF